MEPDEYFERVVRFLQTKGWNTSTTQVNRQTYVVTGTRESDTYYDRMLTMVVIDEETKIGTNHLEYLLNAAQENDVDHMMATCRAGLEDGAREIATEHDIELIDTETIDDAFIDEFTIEDGSILDQTALNGGLVSGPVAAQLAAILGLYLLVGIGIGVMAALGELLLEEDGLISGLLLPGTVLVGGPLLAAVGPGTVVDAGVPRSPVASFLGSALGYLVLLFVVGIATAAIGSIGSTGLFSPNQNFFTVGLFALPVGIIGGVGSMIANRGREDSG